MVAYTRKKLYHAVKVVLIRSAGQQEPLEKTGYERKKKVTKKIARGLEIESICCYLCPAFLKRSVRLGVRTRPFHG